MSIETEKSSCPYCSTQLEYRHINLTEKMLICTKKKCLFPFDLDDVSPYIIAVDSSIEKEQDSGSSSSSLLDDKLFNLKKSNPSLDLNGSSSAQSKNTSTKFESSPSSLESPSTESYNKSRCSAGSRPPTKLTTQSSTRSNKKSTSNSNNSITLKTLGVTLKVDQTDKNKLQPNPTDPKNGSSSVSLSNSDLVSSSNMNEIPAPVVEPSLVNTAGNGLLDVNTAGGSDNGNVLTVGEYTRMLLGKSGIDIDLDNLSLNPDIVDMSMRGNDTMMELDGFLGTFDPLESGNNIDFDSLMVNLDGNFMEAGVLNDVSGNNYDIDLNSILVNGNGNIIDSVNSNEVQNNGVSDIHSGKTIFDNINV